MRATLPLSLLLVSLLLASLALPAWAQTTGKPLNLKLPPGDLPQASASAAASARSTQASRLPGGDAPGVYYGDTSGRTYADSDADDSSACDDSTYNKAQLHGSVGVGVMAGDHFGGSYEGGQANLSKRFGSCDEPAGGISISVGGTHGRFHQH